MMQTQNGPCGALVAFQAWLVCNLFDSGNLRPNCRPDETNIAEAICSILFQCKGSRSTISIYTWVNPRDTIGADVDVLELPVGSDGSDSRELVVASILSAIDQFTAPGGNTRLSPLYSTHMHVSEDILTFTLLLCCASMNHTTAMPIPLFSLISISQY
jgi:hypothetical protein